MSTRKVSFVICKEYSEVGIFDGVTLGTIKEVPPFSMQFDKSQLILPIPQILRTFISSKTKREDILGYLENELPIRIFSDFVQSPEISPLANYIEQEVLWMIIMLFLGTAI